MSQLTEAGKSTDDEALKDIFNQAMKMYDAIENGKEPTNSDAVQVSFLQFILASETLKQPFLNPTNSNIYKLFSVRCRGKYNMPYNINS